MHMILDMPVVRNIFTNRLLRVVNTDNIIYISTTTVFTKVGSC